MTKFIGGSAIYSTTLVSEEVARIVANRSSSEPVHSWELPKQLPSGPVQQEIDFDRDE